MAEKMNLRLKNLHAPRSKVILELLEMTIVEKYRYANFYMFVGRLAVANEDLLKSCVYIYHANLRQTVGEKDNWKSLNFTYVLFV